LETAVSRLFTGKPRLIDLARIEDNKGRYTIVDNGVGIGFDATISIEARNITRLHGFPMYILATLRTIAFYYQTPHCEIRFDDEKVSQPLLLLAVGVGPRAGGGFHITPHAQFDDNVVDSCLISPVGRLTMLGMLTKVMKGTHIKHRAVTMRKNTRLVLKANMPLPIHTDGEIFAYPHDDVREVAITSLPGAIQVMV
jgi:diacylglycerol kinase family enzyme